MIDLVNPLAASFHAPEDLLLTERGRPVDRTDYGPSIWSHILRDQLEVSTEEFWSCVEDRVRPTRGQPPPPAETIPAGVVKVLTAEAHIPETVVRAMTKAEAVQRLAEFYTTGE